MNALIVIPVFDEAATIGRVVRAARAHGAVLVVDDGSRDASAAIARAAGAEVVRHPRRLGKGQAIRTGIAAARSRGASLVVTLDGDGQHDPGDLAAVLAAARSTPGTLVIGGRLRDPRLLAADRLNAIRVAGFFVNWASGLALEDTQSGFRAYPLAFFDDVRPRRGGFVFETEALVAAGLRGWPVREVPVTTIARAGRRSRFHPIADGVAIGAYLAGRVLVRWGLEAGAAVAALGGARAHLHSPGSWTSLGGWWRHPRRRRAAVAARATLAAPAVLPLLVVQALVAGRDFTSPLVTRLCSQDRLDAPHGREPLIALVAQEKQRP
ncbi:MAG: glycosyltransferase family 2 protein [Candidatus Rokuibacteriota bacterium]|nr:MAG: glycosyltransferase family 2 protein [Candidatus Rokubacteria bacterium]